MIKIFMTGDNHIGLKYASHSKANELVAARIDAFEGMVDKANEEQCDLFVITGDLFENTYSITKRDTNAIIDILARFKGRVVVLPGNHDYYDKDVKVWQYFKAGMEKKDNIMLLTEYKTYSLEVNDEQVVLYPALCTSLHSEPMKNNLGWIKEEVNNENANDNNDLKYNNLDGDSANKDSLDKNNVYRIGIAHGSIEGETIDTDGRYFLMKREELESIPLDVWLIGHTHVPFPRNLKEDEYTIGERIFNAGTHVQTDVNCDTLGECFILEIDEDKVVKAKKYVSGNVNFVRLNVDLAADKMQDMLEDALKKVPSNSVVDVILSGAVSASEYEERFDIIEEALDRFIEGTYDEHRMSKLITKEIIDSELAQTSFLAEFLTELLDEPKEAQLVYDLIGTLKEGK